jgi:hypothetical protein
VTRRIAIAVERGARKAFATAIDWPGWSRSGKTEELALEALAAAAPRYAAVASMAGEVLPASPRVLDLEVVERNPGSAGTDYGVPSRVLDHDRRPVSAPEAARLRTIVASAWSTFDRVAGAAPQELRKGPRGGGRDRDRIREHVLEADHAYGHEIGLRVPRPSLGDPDAIHRMRSEMLNRLGQPSDGSPLGGRRWPVRYAAHRIAWHALDHAWEIEDRSSQPP